MDSSLVADVAQSKDESVNMKLKNLVSIFTMTSVEDWFRGGEVIHKLGKDTVAPMKMLISSGKEAFLFIFDLPLL